MARRNVEAVLKLICREDPRFDKNAYIFVNRALEYTVKRAAAEGSDAPRHVRGGELLEGVRLFALEEYGPLARTVLEHWGVRRCEDIGAIVFHMVDYKLLGKTDEDSPADFEDGYDFYKAFDAPFLPEHPRAVRGV